MRARVTNDRYLRHISIDGIKRNPCHIAFVILHQVIRRLEDLAVYLLELVPHHVVEVLLEVVAQQKVCLYNAVLRMNQARLNCRVLKFVSLHDYGFVGLVFHQE